ncbi:putative N-acetylgalactosaminide beta-1,3-galactosyltransferase [Rosa chinensis]|uniref:Putative N-acetylgalactosaminide beta-1,3-galactosyltransferase n=1 Tax=Rosa chinensis TaxID=74649 RepID=A0A2P6P4I1_ROSCH|nr:uncharacterized protein LOC112175128 [Rosa chinensis]PRQ16802.1 putative N-acetylgalactosaminide beta-1,3-galactosyltransferase [Rosa chinensis]
MTTMSTNPNTSPKDQTNSRSPKSRRWRQSQVATAVIAIAALLISTAAWLSLVFSGSPPSLTVARLQNKAPAPSFAQYRNDSVAVSEDEEWSLDDEELSLDDVVFGIAGSSGLWKQRKEYVRLWWRPDDMRGHVWMDEKVPGEENDESSLPPIMVSEDISRFRYTNPTGHPSGLRISRIISECFRLVLPKVRWFVLADDDTIINADNLVAVLSKYDASEMVYVGSPSESHSANTYFSHSMAFGGGGIAISYPLAKALSEIQDECLERYPKLYGSDDRLHACITELGVPLSREPGFHQYDIRGNAHGLLSSHPIAPFVSIHHVEAVDPFYPGLDSLQSLKLFTHAMRLQPSSFLQRSICYDRRYHLTFSVSLGYAVQVFPQIVLPRDLERSEQTYSAWNGITRRNEFDMDTKDVYRSVCKKPILFFLKDIRSQGNATLGSYMRSRAKDDFKRTVLCFPRSRHLRHLRKIQVLGHPLTKKWHLVPRRLCCQLNQKSDEFLRLEVGQCAKGASGSITNFK